MRRKASATKVAYLYKVANFSKKAQRPYMPEVNMKAYKQNLAFMAHMIDAGRNNSKFYEMAIVPHRDGTATLTKMWGALGKGKTRTKVEHFDNLEMAQKAMNKHGKGKLQKGYVNAFLSAPKGQYPIGLDRAGPGFGWGTQSIRTQINALKEMAIDIEEGMSALRSSDNLELIENLEQLKANLENLDDGMAKEIRRLIVSPLNKLRSGELDERLTRKYLTTLKNYIKNQLKYHQ